MTTRIGILGYGNLGRGVELAIQQNPDMELAGVFTRRNPESVTIATEGVPVRPATDLDEAAVNDIASDHTITLTGDVVAGDGDRTIAFVREGATIAIDLAGHAINRNLSSLDEDNGGHVLDVNKGTLVVRDTSAERRRHRRRGHAQPRVRLHRRQSRRSGRRCLRLRPHARDGRLRHGQYRRRRRRHLRRRRHHRLHERLRHEQHRDRCRGRRRQQQGLHGAHWLYGLE